MSRLDIKTPSRAQTVVEGLYRDMERRIAASPPGLCPVDMSLSFLQLCHAQTCGKCVPCRIGLGQLTLLIPEGQIANMGYVGGFYSIERNHLPVMVIGAGAGRVELGGRFRVRPDFNRRFGTGRGG